jgi:uncharacterized membrane protein
MKQKLTKAQRIKERAKESAIRFKRELKKSIVTAIVAAFSFLIALSWRDLITEWVTKISESSPIKSSFITTTIITFIGVIGILLISRWGNEK